MGDEPKSDEKKKITKQNKKPKIKPERAEYLNKSLEIFLYIFTKKKL